MVRIHLGPSVPRKLSANENTHHSTHFEQKNNNTTNLTSDTSLKPPASVCISSSNEESGETSSSGCSGIYRNTRKPLDIHDSFLASPTTGGCDALDIVILNNKYSVVECERIIRSHAEEANEESSMDGNAKFPVLERK